MGEGAVSGVGLSPSGNGSLVAGSLVVGSVVVSDSWASAKANVSGVPASVSDARIGGMADCCQAVDSMLESSHGLRHKIKRVNVSLKSGQRGHMHCKNSQELNKS